MKSLSLAVIAVAAILLMAACGGEDPSTDPDGDGFVGASDECPGLAETVNGYQDSDGCPDSLPSADADRDGVSDETDNCPSQPETPNGYMDNDGCPDTVPIQDSDGDGIADTSDSCPSTKETVNGNRDSDGCPDLLPTYTGRWSGQATLQFDGEAPWFNNTVVLTGSVNDDRVTVSPVCPLGDGSVTTNIYTDQQRASWSGAMDCAPIGFTNGCQFVVLTFRSIAFSLAQTGQTLGASGSGTATGCGITKGFQMTFAGVRQ